jgi:hypothetical protein
VCGSQKFREQVNKEDASLEHLRIQYRVILHVWQILHAHQRGTAVEEILRHGNEAETALGELLSSTYQGDVAPEEQPAKGATKRTAPIQGWKRNGQRTPATGNPPPAPTKKRGASRTPKTPMKRRAAAVTDDEQEDTLGSPAASKNNVPRSGRFEEQDKFFQLLGMSRSETSGFRPPAKPSNRIQIWQRAYTEPLARSN